MFRSIINRSCSQAHSFLPILLFVYLTCHFLTAFSATEDHPKKVALVFLTRNGVNHPDLWKPLIQNHADQFNVYLYSDHPLKDPFFDDLRIKETIPTSWDYHIKTWQLLLTRAYQEKENYKFVYLSESCVPLIPLEDLYQTLTRDDTSYMCFAGPWWPKDNPREVIGLPEKHRFGNHEWVILNRKHAGMIVDDDVVIDIVSKFWIDSESYPSTLFSVQNCLGEFNRRPTTYVNWALPEGGGAHPYHFREKSPFNHAMLLEAKKGGYFFARKFTTSYPAEAILEMIHTSQ